MKIPYEYLLPIYRLIWKRWRAQRWERFRSKIKPQPHDSLLDVGGCPSDWIGRNDLVSSVDLVNLIPYQGVHRDDSPKIRSFTGDGRKLAFSDSSYNVVYSNSVIEHVGNWDDQRQFAEEVRRVGQRLWIQSPAKECPIEPHYMGAIFHWFPQRWHVPLARWTSVVGLTKAADLESIASSTRLLSKREFRELFPDCEIWTERLLWIFPKSYIAIRKGNSR